MALSVSCLWVQQQEFWEDEECKIDGGKERTVHKRNITGKNLSLIKKEREMSVLITMTSSKFRP